MYEDDSDHDASDSSLTDLGSDGDSSSGGESDDDGWLNEELMKEKGEHESGAPLTAWTSAVHKAFLRGIHLVPDLGVSRYPLGSQLLMRNGMVSEYIVRQTGEYRTSRQVGSHISAIRRVNKCSKGLRRALRGHRISHDKLDNMDWNALLGPDKYPHVNVAERKNVGWKGKGVKRKAPPPSPPSPRKKVQPQLGSTASTTPVVSSSTSGIGSSWTAPRSSTRRDVASLPASRLSLPSTTHEPFLFSQPSSFQPVSPVAPPLVALLTQHPFLSTLAAFLAGLHPSLVPLAPCLVAAGVDSIDALAKLVLLEPPTVALVLEGARRCAEGPVSVVQLRLLGRLLDEAGRALRAGR
ncbi:hypothetical protein JCM3775_002583 [Rhodotorula graminis]